MPKSIIGDKAYDSDDMDERLLKERGISLVAPHKVNRKRPKTQDGRPLRRYVRRWKVERALAWLQKFRRFLIRYERKLENYLGFVQLAMMRIYLKCF